MSKQPFTKTNQITRTQQSITGPVLLVPAKPEHTCLVNTMSPLEIFQATIDPISTNYYNLKKQTITKKFPPIYIG
jgi:hypothetical protein